MPPPTNRDRILGGLWGTVVGDALGVPAEFLPREHLRRQPITGMTGGGHHRQLPGTWSDYTALTLIAAHWLPHGLPPARVLASMASWHAQGVWSARGDAFDVGSTTLRAISSWLVAPDRASWGVTDPLAAGNGSVMRNLPVALWHRNDHPANVIAAARHASAITHASAICQAACALHALVVIGLCRGFSVAEALAEASVLLSPSLGPERTEFDALLTGEVLTRPEFAIRSTGYTVHTLEAAVWCLHRYQTFTEAVLAAVNLGDDSDTAASVTGGLAGVREGITAIPEAWRQALANQELLRRTMANFLETNASLAP